MLARARTLAGCYRSGRMVAFAVRARSLVLVSLLVWLGGCQRPGAAPGFASGPLVTKEATPEISALERAMHARLNRDRAKAGLPPLEFDAKLADVARGHSEDMRQRNFFSHDSPYTGSFEDRLDRAGLVTRAARENLGEGSDVDGTQDALLKSPGHHANIMAADVTHVGIGIVQVGTKQAPRLLVTQVFATPVKNQDASSAQPAVLRKIADARKKSGLRPLAEHELLGRLAKEHVAELADDLGSASSKKIGESVMSKLAGTGLSGVTVGGSVFVSADLYEPQGAVMSPKARALGVATAPAKDERGRPAIKVLLLIGD